jgi:hypothetical protein
VYRRWRDIHEIFQLNMLFGITNIELDLEAYAVILHQLRRCERQITTHQLVWGMTRLTTIGNRWVLALTRA